MLNEEEKGKKLVELIGSMSASYDRSTNGHGTSHILGVLDRSVHIADAINKNPQKYEAAPVKHNVAMAVAALHDIGDLGGTFRTHHNLMSMGVVQGHLSVRDCIYYNPKIDGDFKSALLAIVDQKPMASSFSHWDLSTKKAVEDAEKAFAKSIIDVLQTKQMFDYAYFGEKGDARPDPDFDKLRGLLASIDVRCSTEFLFHFDNFENKEKIVESIEKYQGLDISSYWQGITNGLEEIYPAATSAERDYIALACAEHNMDFFDLEKENRGERYLPQNVYSRIIIDADKDDSPIAFAARTIQYSLAQTEGLPREERKERACLHVTTQAWQRFRTVSTPFPEKLLRVELNGNTSALAKVKGVHMSPINPGNGIAQTIAVDNNTGVFYFCEGTERGVDVDSVCDLKAGAGVAKDIEELRHSALYKLSTWADPQNFDESKKEISQIYDTLIQIEKDYWGIDGYPKQISPDTVSIAIMADECRQRGFDFNEYTLRNVVQRHLDPAKIEHEMSLDQMIKNLMSTMNSVPSGGNKSEVEIDRE